MNITSKMLGAYATQSMQEELDTTPKAGLVDKDNNGAHTDMNYALLCKSIKAIEPCMEQFSNCATGCGNVMPDLIKVGLAAEKAMFDVTCGVNTHKGAIFCLGLAVASATICANTNRTTLNGFCGIIARLSSQLSYGSLPTHGATVREKYNIKGALEYAKEGYYDILTATVNNYLALAQKGITDNTANIINLLYIISQIDDTNIYYRAGEQVAKQVKDKAKALYNKWCAGEVDYADIYTLNDEFTAQNISTGGAADLLILAIFTQKLITNKVIKP